MARVDQFSGLTEFLAVAELGSFRAAAARLRVTPGAMSQAIKSLETRLGLPLFVRTTRSLALTETGNIFLDRLRPAAGDIQDAVSAVGSLRGRPSGHLRLSVPRIAIDLAIVPILPAFNRAFPDISIEIDVNDASIDLAAEGFDAGIRIGHFIERDMVAVRLTPNFRWFVLGAPSYFRQHQAPKTPEDLVQHRCIGYRFPTAKTVYRWQFKRQNRLFSVDIARDLIVNDHLTMLSLARAGVGLVYTADLVAGPDIAAGTLRPVMQGYASTDRGLYLYFPARAQTQPKLRAFIDTAKSCLQGGRRAV